MTMWMPVAVWGLHRTLASGRLRDGLITGAAFGAQMLSALYYGTFLIPYLFVIGGCLWLARGFPLKPLRALAAGAVRCGRDVRAGFRRSISQTRPYMGNRPVADVRFYSAEGPDYLKAHYRSRYLWLDVQGCQAGTIAVPADCAGRAAGACAVAAALGDADCLRPRDGVFRRGLVWVQPVVVPAALRERSAVRQHPRAGSFQRARGSVARGPLGIWRGPPVQPLAARPARAHRGDAGRHLLRSAAEHRAGPRPWREPPPIYGSFAGKPPSVLAEFPMPEASKDPFSEFTYLYFSTFHWQKLVNGQSGWLPPSYLDLLYEQKDFPSEKADRLPAPARRPVSRRARRLLRSEEVCRK